MRKRTVLTLLACLVGSALAFWYLDPVLAAAVAIGGSTLVVLGLLASDWDRHPDFEQRELDRARRRAARRERTKGARDRDRARWEAHQAKKAARGRG